MPGCGRLATIAPLTAATPADSPGAYTRAMEHFETFDDNGQPLGLVPRPEVHARGLWHKSVHVLLFSTDGALIVQRRAPGKDLYPNCWDLSVGEHLQPGESYLAGALRGLAEELAVTGVTLTPLGGVHRAVTEVAHGGLLDRELQQAFRGVHDGPILPCPDEVAEVRRVTLSALERWVAREPDQFTPWLWGELRRHGLVPQNKPS